MALKGVTSAVTSVNGEVGDVTVSSSPGGSPTQLQYHKADGTFDGVGGSSVDDTNQRVGFQKASPEAPIHVASTVAATLPNVSNLSVELTPESLIAAPSALATIVYVPGSPTNCIAGEVDVGAGAYISAGQTYNYDIFAYRLINGVYYVYSSSSTSYTDSANDGHTFNVSVVCDAMPYADGYFFYNSSNNQYFDSATNSAIDSNSWSSGSPSYTNISSGGFIAAGQTLDFYPVGYGTSPSGQPYYSVNGSVYSVTDTLNDGQPFIIQHSSGSTLPVYMVDNTTNANEAMFTSPFIQPFPFAGFADLSTKHYGFQSNGSLLNKTYRVNTYDSYRGIYSSGAEDAVTDPNDAAYYYITGTFDSLVHPPATMTYKKFRKQTSGAYGNSIYNTATTFYDDALSAEYASSATVTPTSVLPNAFIAEADSDSATDQAIAVVRSTAASNAVASLQGQNAIGGNLWTVRNSGNDVYLGNDSSTGSMFLGNLTSPQAQFGAANTINVQKNSSVHTTIWGSNATLPNLYSFSAHNTVYFGKSSEGSDPLSSVVIQPKAVTSKGLSIRQFSGSQSANLLNITNVSGSTLSAFDFEGKLGVYALPLTTANLTVGAGSTAKHAMVIGNGALKTGTLVSGGIDRLNDILYFTINTGLARKIVLLTDGAALTVDRIPFALVSGRLVDNDGFKFSTTAGLIGNDAGTSTIDLRWEGDTDSNLLMVDASADKIGFGVGAGSISAKAHIVSTSEQLRVGYDVLNYFSTTVSSAGAVTFDAVGSAPKFIFADLINIPTKTPATAAAAGVAGDIAWDTNYIYVATAANTWKRAAITTW